jgi:hypothetical protein
MHLGYSWIIIERKFPELKGPLRNPYPTIGERAFGPWARYLGQKSLLYEYLNLS